MIYASERFSTAMLEKLARGSGRLPPNQHDVQMAIPRGLTYEVFSPPSLPGWDSMPTTVSRAFGEGCCVERRSLILIVPSVVARLDNYILINPAHPEFHAIEASLHQPVFWDRRLFGSSAGGGGQGRRDSTSWAPRLSRSGRRVVSLNADVRERTG